MTSTRSRHGSSEKASRFTESVIREMSRVAQEHGALNLAQGFPDFPAPCGIKEAAERAIQADVNQYAVTWGAPNLRAAIGNWYRERRGVAIDPDSQVTVVCGATEGMVAAMMGVLNPGQEILIPEPFYENYGPDCILIGAVPVYVPLGPGFHLDVAALRAACTAKTRAIVLNTPHNPTGRVFSKEEVNALCKLVLEKDLLLFTDEIYEEILFTGPHQTPLLWDGMAERTLVISGASKTWSITGWRVGWVVSPPHLTSGIRKVHDFLTVGAPAPLQEAVAEAMAWPDSFYDALRMEYRERRDLLVHGLQELGFGCTPPEGAYYVMADISRLRRKEENDIDFALRLTRDGGVATVPGSSFYANPEHGKDIIRFCYAKKKGTLEQAVQAMRTWMERE